MSVKNRIMLSICHDGPASRTELAKKFGLSASHICEAVAALIDEGVLIELGYRMAKKARGRKNTLLDLNPTYKFALGIGFADNVLSIGLTTVKGDVLGKMSMAVTDETSKEDAFSAGHETAMRLLRDSCLEANSLLGIGLCIKLDSAERFFSSQNAEDIISQVKKIPTCLLCLNLHKNFFLLTSASQIFGPRGFISLALQKL